MAAGGFSGGFQPGFGNAVPCSLVEISVSCRKLVDMDVFSKSDPMVVLFTKETSTNSWKEFGRTEIIWNNLNPVFVKKFVMDYYFEEAQHLKFEVYDVDSKSRDLAKHDFLGSSECTLGEIVSSARLQKPLRGPQVNSGSIIFTAEELSSCKEEVTLQLCGHKLDKKDFFGKSDPFLTFYRSNEDGSFTAVHKTEVIKSTLKPTWRTFTCQVRTLCNGDHDRSIKVDCFDWNQNGSHSFIGSFITSLRELSRGPGPYNVYELINQEKKAKKKGKYKHSGTIELLSAKVVTVPTFLDFIKGGMQIHCTISIDFTASNGNPQSPTSLHYMSPYQPNLYARALRAVGEIIQDYDSTKMFPALGFGARLPPNGTVSHEFFLNGDATNPYCQGIEGVLQAYNMALKTVQLYGPTNFAPTINHVARFAGANRSGTDYYILLILTDGVITDMPQTKEAIVNASVLPLSIIIVGIGDAEFDAMDELDGDEVRLSSRGRVAARDIVQFVPFREFLNTARMDVSQARLAKEVLAEVPDQVISYMKANNIKPRPPLQRQDTFPTAPPT